MAALGWPLNVWLEVGLWLALALSIAVAYAVSYASLGTVAGAFGYGTWERWAVPIAVDVPLFASVMGQLLAARWGSPWWVKVALFGLSLVTAPLTLAGNALRGTIRGDGSFDWRSFDVPHLVAFGVPGLTVVLVAAITSIMLGQRSQLIGRALAGGTPTPEPDPNPEPPAPPPPPGPPPADFSIVEPEPKPIDVDGREPVTLARAMAAYRERQASGERVTGSWLGERLGVSAVRGRHWRKQVEAALAERPFRSKGAVAA